MLPFGFRRRWHSSSPRRRWAYGLTAAAAAVFVAFFVASAVGQTTDFLPGDPAKFESGDGNMTVDIPFQNDWNSVQGDATTGCLNGANVTVGATTHVGTCTHGSYVHIVDDANTGANPTDLQWKPGQKMDASCPVLNVGGSPPKDSFTDVASYNDTNLDSASPQDGHVYLDGSTIRETANGDAAENVELHQASDQPCSTTVNGLTLLQRSAGDKLIAIDYTGGGTVVTFTVLTWIDSSHPNLGGNSGTCLISNDSTTNGCWGAFKDTLSSNTAQGFANQTTIDSADNGISGQTLGAGKFAEFGIDLTAANIIPLGTCKAFSQTVWESRSSGSSFTSNPADVEVEGHTISTCGEIKIVKATKNAAGTLTSISQVFHFSSASAQLPANSGAGGVPCVTNGSAGVDASGSFCLNNDGTTGHNTVDNTDLPGNTYTITEAQEPAGWNSDGAPVCTGGTGTNTGSGLTATVQLNPGDIVTCTFTNDQQLGSIEITKASVKTVGATTTHETVAGAHFEVCTNNGPYDPITNPCHAVTNGADVTTGANGTVCVSGLPFGGAGATSTTYYVTETTPPIGFAPPGTKTQAVDVTASASDCSGSNGTPASATFTDTPLSQITVSFHALGTNADSTPGTAADILACEAGTTPPTADTGGSDITPNSSSGSTTSADRSKTFGDGTATLTPGTYTCTVHIDP